MTTLTTSLLSDTLSATIPKLKAEGDNWAIFFIQFMVAVKAKGFWGHFDGSTLKPTLSNGDSFETKCGKTMGGSGEGVYTKGSLHAN